MALWSYIAEEITLDCAEGLLTRREALRRLGLMGLTGAAAAAVLAGCGDDDDSASSTIVPGTKPPGSVPASSSAAAGGEEIRFSGPNGELIGVVADAPSPK